MRILLDNNVPLGVRRFLIGHEVRSVIEAGLAPQIENGELLKAAEEAFDILLTSDQNIRHQQNLTRRRLALIVLGSNIWPVVSSHGAAIVSAIEKTKPGSYQFVEMPLPKKPQRRSRQ